MPGASVTDPEGQYHVFVQCLSLLLG